MQNGSSRNESLASLDKKEKVKITKILFLFGKLRYVRSTRISVKNYP